MEYPHHLKLKVLCHPGMILRHLLKKLPLNFLFELRLELDAVPRPFYAYPLLQAAYQARGLGIKEISAIEFGVASGNGLVVLEKLAKQVSKITGVKIAVYGFDLETGLPPPVDYRDLPFAWRRGQFQMDKAALLKRLSPETSLVLGDVSETVPEFLQKPVAPIGFVAIDLDYYSSTKNALKILQAENEKVLPRVFCYFDDIIANDAEIMSQYNGELLAINEFNAAHSERKLDLINGLKHKRIVAAQWPDMIYVLHSFNHRLYNNFVLPGADR